MNSAIARLEVRAVLRARWFLASVGLALALVGFFVIVATRESSVIGFTGYGRVLGGVVQASLLFLPLLALFSTTQAITGAQQQGVLEWYLSYPTTRAGCFWAMFAPRFAAVAAPATIAVLALGGVGAVAGEGLDAAMLATFLTMLVGQAFCFASVGMWVSAISRAPEQALLRGLVLWMAAAALVDFVVLGLLLRWDLPPYLVFALAGFNPVQAGRIGLLAVVDPQLGVLGPVGTWATTTLGPASTVAYGLGWPIILGVVALLAAWRAFHRRDIA